MLQIAGWILFGIGVIAFVIATVPIRFRIGVRASLYALSIVAAVPGGTFILNPPLMRQASGPNIWFICILSLVIGAIVWMNFFFGFRRIRRDWQKRYGSHFPDRGAREFFRIYFDMD